MLRFAFKSMAVRKVKLIMTALAMILTAGVALLAYNISTQVSEGIVNTAAKFDIIIGPSGSATQLAMNTMFFTDKPLGTIPYSVVEDLRASGLVNAAIPFSMGDSFNAAPIVGTDALLLDGKALSSGSMFSQPLEAVVGWSVAKDYGLKAGDEIISSHGLNTAGSHHSESPLTVVGILQRTNTAYDNAVFTPVSTIWALHSHGEEAEDAEASPDAAVSPAPEALPEMTEAASSASEAPSEMTEAASSDPEVPSETTAAASSASNAPWSHGAPRAQGQSEATQGSADDDHDDHDDHDDGAICAVLVRSTGFNAYSRLMAIYGQDSGFLAINPNTVLREVLDNVDLSRRIVYILCAVILAMNLLVVTVISLLNMVDSRREISLMRLIGIGMGRIRRLYLIQNIFAGVAAMALALMLSRLCLLGIHRYVAGMGIALDAWRIYPAEWLILLAVFIVSILPTTVCTHIMARRDGL